MIQRLRLADGLGMLVDVVLKLLHHKSMDDLGRFMRERLSQALIKLQHVARSAMSFVGDGSHQFSSHPYAEGFAGIGGSCDSLQARFSIFPGTSSFGFGPVTIIALQLHSSRRRHDAFAQMSGMVESNRNGCCSRSRMAQGSKFRMVAVEPANVGHET